jgi:predicted RNA-binding Zn-ribbon protein involved in translation (DUF1610 family)
MIIDFFEILGRGIIAARTGRSEEALKYLTLASKIEPANPRVWLWMAAAEDTYVKKQQYLEQALRADPHNFVAKVLLDQLGQKETANVQPASDFAVFTCPYCGGKQQFDPDISGMRCEYCKKVEPLYLKNASDAESILDANLQDRMENRSVVEAQAVCGACGAKTSLLKNRTTLRCPFCDADLVTIQPATPGIVTPTAIVPFEYHTDDIVKAIGDYWNIQPAKINHLLDTREMIISSIYLPCWSFDGRVQIRCALNRRVSAATYSSNERVILMGEWPMEKSWFEFDFDDHLVYAAHSISEDVMEKILPFDVKSVLEYRPEVLAGWQSEYYQITLQDAAVVAQKRLYDKGFKKAASRGLFMEPSQMLHDDVRLVDQTYKLILLPVYIILRTVSGRTQRILINGQNGKIADQQSNRTNLVALLTNVFAHKATNE